MAQLLVLYKTPKDTAAFDKYYFETHAPLAKAIPGVRKYEVSQGRSIRRAGPPTFIWSPSCSSTAWRRCSRGWAARKVRRRPAICPISPAAVLSF